MKIVISLIITAALLALCLVSCVDVEESYEKLEKHITANSAAVDGVNRVTLGKSTSGGAEYIRSAARFSNKIELTLSVSEGEELRTFTLVLNKSSFDSYKWYYSSSVTGGTMGGTIIPEDYLKDSSRLGYTFAGTSDEYEIASMSAYAKGMCNYLLESLASDLSGLGLSAADFGFEDYED